MEILGLPMKSTTGVQATTASCVKGLYRNGLLICEASNDSLQSWAYICENDPSGFHGCGMKTSDDLSFVFLSSLCLGRISTAQFIAFHRRIFTQLSGICAKQIPNNRMTYIHKKIAKFKRWCEEMQRTLPVFQNNAFKSHTIVNIASIQPVNKGFYKTTYKLLV